MAVRWSALLGGTLVAAILSACAAPTQYMGIPFASEQSAQPPDPATLQAERKRDILILIAALEGCYRRTVRGLETIAPEDAQSFACARRLADIEARSALLTSGRGPTGLPALSLARLARMAQTGNKNAQLELGIRFERGIGVSQDWSKARKLYGSAAADTEGTIWVYSPPVGNGTTGRVIPLDTGPRRPGLKQASERLEALKQQEEARRE